VLVEAAIDITDTIMPSQKFTEAKGKGEGDDKV
jgi:hypothetical protein